VTYLNLLFLSSFTKKTFTKILALIKPPFLGGSKLQNSVTMGDECSARRFLANSFMRHLLIAPLTLRVSRSVLHLVLLAVLTLGLVLAITPASLAQLELPAGFNLSSGGNPPPEVVRLGSIEIAPVHSPITGKMLFEVAAPTVYDRSAAEADLTGAVERRAEEVNARLRRATLQRQNPEMDLETLTVALGKLNGVNVITVQDANYTQPLVLVSVTQTDADYHGVPLEELG
jgi:hypothetical protein